MMLCARATFFALGLPLCATFSPAADAPWGEDFQLAKARAAKSGKDVVICFTFQRENAICRRFAADFLANAPMVEPLAKNFELLWFDVGDEPENPEESCDSRELRRRFEIETYPAVVMTDSQLLPYAYTGYRPGGTKSYPDHLAALKRRHEGQVRMLGLARKAKGVGKARFLAQAIPKLGGLRSAKFYGDMMREIIELDPNDDSGLVEPMRLQLADLAYTRKMQELGEEVRWMEMVELTNAYIRDYKLTGSRKQAALMNRFDIQRRQTNLRGMLKTLSQVIEINQYNHHGRQAQEILQAMTEELQLQQALQSAPPAP